MTMPSTADIYDDARADEAAAAQRDAPSLWRREILFTQRSFVLPQRTFPSHEVTIIQKSFRLLGFAFSFNSARPAAPLKLLLLLLYFNINKYHLFILLTFSSIVYA